jgi:gliding motility-associated-like protein
MSGSHPVTYAKKIIFTGRSQRLPDIRTMMNNSPLRYLISLVFSAFFFAAAQAQPLVIAYLSTPANANVLSEDCDGPYRLIILRTADSDDTITITLNSTGEATLGIDFNFPPGTFPLILLPSQDSIVLDISVVNDGVPEGISNGEESLVLELNSTDGTSSGTFVLQGHAITDAYFVNLNISGDTVSTCDFGISTLSVATGASWESSGFAFFRPEIVTEPGWYYLQVGSDTCGAKDSIYVDLQAGHVAEDTLFICDDGDGIQVNPVIFGEEVSFTWIPADSTVSDTTILTPILNPTITTTYILDVEFEGCSSRDTFVVRVDSLPDDMHIDIAPLKPYYCAGEIVALFSPSYDSLAYPDITFEWTPNDNTFLSDRTLLNAALQLQDTTTYIRINRNNACMSQNAIPINVVPAGVPLTVTDTTLCPGAQFEVTVLSNQVTDPEWTPGDGLSCTMCLSPTVTVTGMPGSVQSYMFSGKILECPVGANLVIHIPPIQPIIIAGNTGVCDNEQVPLNIQNPANLTDIQWNVVSGSATLSCTNCLNPVVTATELPVTLNVLASTTDTAYCGSFGSITLTEGMTEQFVGLSFAACDEGTVQLGPVNPAYTNLEWSVFDGSMDLSCTNCPNPIVTIHETGTVILNADYSSGDTCHVIIRFPVSTFTPDNADIVQLEPVSDTVAQGSPVVLQLSNTLGNPTNIVWTVNGTVVPGTGLTVSFNANEEVNEVIATFINTKGCEETATLTINTVPPFYQIPNAFTPNGDGLNDRFRILVNGDIRIQTFLIFNRWGQLVYEGPADDIEGWDGIFKGQKASSDTYVYTATLEFPDRVETVKGDVMLIR